MSGGGGEGGWPVSFHIYNQGAVKFSLYSEHTSCVGGGERRGDGEGGGD